MQLFADKAGKLLDIVGGFAPVKEPEGTVNRFRFDENTNTPLARLLGERETWDTIIRITDDTVFVNGVAWPVQPDSDQLNQQKEVQARIDRLFASERLPTEDVQPLLQLIVRTIGFQATTSLADVTLAAKLSSSA